jgi:hypothetical protein
MAPVPSMRELVGGDAGEERPRQNDARTVPIADVSIGQLRSFKALGSRVAFAVLTLTALGALLDWVWS